MSFGDRELDRLGQESRQRIVAAWKRARERQARPRQVVGLAAALLARHSLAAQRIGRAYARRDARAPLSGSLLLPAAPSDGRSYRPLPSRDWDAPEVKGGGPGRIEENPTERYEAAFTTIVEEDDQSYPRELERVELLAYNEPIQAAQAGYQAELQSEGIKGYRRLINPDACQICFWLWKEGYVYPITKSMWRHTGCRCVPVPTTDRIGFHDLSEADQAKLSTFQIKHE